jgi:aminopeptidase C
MAKKREAEALPKGLSFFAKKKVASTIGEIKEKELDKIINEIYESLAESGVSLHKAKILDKDFTLMTEEMILNGFYLIEESRLNEFRGKADEFREKFNQHGIKIEMSGPWPSYHFICL